MELHHLYRSLGILSAEDSFIQSQLYANSERLCAQNSKVLYYDCTNFFFEIEQEDGIRQYGPSKEHRSSLIVEMGIVHGRRWHPFGVLSSQRRYE